MSTANYYTAGIMWCPSASLSVWANAWLAGVAAPDDVLDALSQWAPTHSVTAYDSVAAGHTGLPWPDAPDTGAVTLLQTLRVSGRRNTPEPAMSIALPVPGDVRGLPAGTQFEHDALAVGEAVIVTDGRGPALGLLPEFDEPEAHTVSWTVYALPSAPAIEHPELGEAEYALRSTVRSAADALGAIRARYGETDADPRTLVQQALDSAQRHRAPADAPVRALRVLEQAAHVDAIISVSSELMPIATATSSDAQRAGDALRPLSEVVRQARIAAVSAMLHAAWRR